MLEIREISSKEIWESFLAECEDKTFLQSWNWGEFSRAMEEKNWRFGVYEGDELIAVALTVKKAAKRGIFLLVPHGPAFAKATAGKPVTKSKIIEVLLDRLKKIAREEKASFIRINSILERSEENNKIFQDFGFREAPMQMHPEASWKLDTTLREDELLAHMRKTTRYLIRQALKNQDLEVSQSDNIEDVRILSKFHNEVSERQHFVPFSFKYLENEFSAFNQYNQVLLFFGKYKEELAAAAFVIFWSGIGFYHHAASYPHYAKFSVPYLLQWEAIKEAQRRGCRLYDFWGFVDPQKQPKHPWAGPTLFKMGFGGRAYEYVKTQDYPLSWRYWPIAMFELLRKKRRHL
mgnify:CR=1 FL=1